MKYGLYIIQDVQTGEISPPFISLNEQSAKRIYTTALEKAPYASDNYVLVHHSNVLICDDTLELTCETVPIKKIILSLPEKETI